jgi:uncharacterized protein (TIGR00730 family)
MSDSTASVFTVCVYCGSRDGASPAYAQVAQAMGQAIAQRGWRLVYGGGHVGLMGRVADAALQGGAHVTGIIPERLLKQEMGHGGVSQLHIVQTMHERKQRMADLSDAFVALPGGIGTMEELFEVWTWHQLGYHGKPLGLLNTEGYFDHLLSFIDHSEQQGFLWPDVHGLLKVETDIHLLLDHLYLQHQQSTAGKLA